MILTLGDINSGKNKMYSNSVSLLVEVHSN